MPANERRSIRDLAGEPVAVDVLAHRPSRAKRNRSWEAKQRRNVGQVTYRGIPRELNVALLRIAAEHKVTVGEVARYFLEYALRAYQVGELSLPEVQVRICRGTIYPEMHGGER